MKKFTRILALTLVLIMSVALFASCAAPNKDPEKAKEALEKNDYEVLLVDKDLDALYKGLEAYLVAADEEDENGLMVYYFESADAANEAWDDMQDEIEEMKKEEEDLVSKKSGKMIYIGTKDAIKAAK